MRLDERNHDVIATFSSVWHLTFAKPTAFASTFLFGVPLPLPRPSGRFPGAGDRSRQRTLPPTLLQLRACGGHHGPAVCQAGGQWRAGAAKLVGRTGGGCRRWKSRRYERCDGVISTKIARVNGEGGETVCVFATFPKDFFFSVIKVLRSVLPVWPRPYITCGRCLELGRRCHLCVLLTSGVPPSGSGEDCCRPIMNFGYDSSSSCARNTKYALSLWRDSQSL